MSLLSLLRPEARRRTGLRSVVGVGNLAEACHIIRPPFMPSTVTWTEDLYSGGTPEGSAKASVKEWAEILRFMGQHLGA